MNIDDFWKRLGNYGVEVPPDVQRRVGLDMNQERVLIRPPSTQSAKLRVMQYGTGVPATYIARELGVTVRQVRKVRQMLRC
jgi:hypothetical protein